MGVCTYLKSLSKFTFTKWYLNLGSAIPTGLSTAAAVPMVEAIE